MQCLWVSAQSSMPVESDSNHQLSMRVLHAYQEHSNSKVEDLYSYFQLLTDSNLSEDTKKEVIDSIYLLFNHRDVQVVDLTSSELETISLSAFISKLRKSKSLVFKLKMESQYNEVSDRGWTIYYSLNQDSNPTDQPIQLTQKVYFTTQSKSFGTSSKNVSATYLGAISTLQK